MEQETLIYIDDNEKYNASVTANSFAHKDTKNRAYINALGAELAIKYLKSENILVPEIKNIHSIKKILEEIDISDIMLPNMHIDVRVVFDENAIFVPKSHFEYNLTPDIYLVFQLAKDFSHVKFLGFFEPKLINKNNANDKYYFIEKEKLNPAIDLVNYIEKNKLSKDINLSEDDIENSQRIMISMADNDVSEKDKKYILEQLTKSAQLRDMFIEYENFETLSFKAMNDPAIEKHEPQQIVQPVDEFEEFDSTFTDEDAGIDTLEELQSPADETATNIDILEEIDELESTVADEDNDVQIENLKELNIDEDITNIDAIEPESSNDNKEDSSLLDTIATIGGVAAAGTIAGSMALGAGEIAAGAEGIDAVSDLVEGASELLEDGLNLAETLTPDAEADEPENIVESIDSKDKKDEEYMDLPDEISDVIEEPLDIENIEEIENIKENSDNETEIISLDDVKEEISENPIVEEMPQDAISLEDIDLKDTEIIDTENLEPEENISLDNIELEENLEPEENQDETISLDNIEMQEEEILETDTDSESINLEDIDETILDTVSEEEKEEETIDLKDIEEKKETTDIIENIDSISGEDETLQDTNIENTIDGIDSIVEEENPKEYSETFGKNLLENLTAEDVENISIEDLGTDENNENPEISPDDLLSQIDNVLNSSQSENPEQETSPEVTIPQDYLEEILDDDDTEHTEISEEDKLNVLYNGNDNVPDVELDEIENLDDMQQPETQEPEPQAPAETAQKSNTKTLIVAGVLVTVLTAGAIFNFMKPKNDTSADIEPLPNKTVTSQNTNDIAKTNETTENILETNAPDVKQTAPQAKKAVQEIKNNPAKPIASGAYLSVNKLVWDVPDTLSYSSKFQNYLRTAGKSIKLSLTADLLLANEYAYSNQVKVNLKLTKDGSIQESKIVTSSGSTQIDNIVLQSVKDTLNVIKPPSEDIKTGDFNLNLIIYF